IVPFETVEKKKNAIERFKKYGLDPKYVPFFYKLDNYKGNERFAGRYFDPDGGGRFCAGLDGRPSFSGDGRVGALPVFEESRDGIVPDMKIVALPEKKK
ncbi:hypothetical protein HYZ41_02420, partial [archaeon]|nr:hypothetical protein [archaeon]